MPATPDTGKIYIMAMVRGKNEITRNPKKTLDMFQDTFFEVDSITSCPRTIILNYCDQNNVTNKMNITIKYLMKKMVTVYQCHFLKPNRCYQIYNKNNKTFRENSFWKQEIVFLGMMMITSTCE